MHGIGHVYPLFALPRGYSREIQPYPLDTLGLNDKWTPAMRRASSFPYFGTGKVQKIDALWLIDGIRWLL